MKIEVFRKFRKKSETLGRCQKRRGGPILIKIGILTCFDSVNNPTKFELDPRWSITSGVYV